jgi:hypothetical protein
MALFGDEKEPVRFKINTKRAEDAVEVQGDDTRTVLVVKSPSGIGEATVERSGDKWPGTVVVRLRLKGLESLQISNGTIRLAAAVSTADGKPKARLWQDGKEDAPLDQKSPMWMDIRLVSTDGKPATELPLKDGYFEMALPKAFLEGNPKTWTLSWIDFHR